MHYRSKSENDVIKNPNLSRPLIPRGTLTDEQVEIKTEGER